MKSVIAVILALSCALVCAAEARKGVHLLPFYFSGTVTEEAARHCDTVFRAALSREGSLAIEDAAATEFLSGKLGTWNLKYSDLMVFLTTRAVYDASTEDRLIVCGELSGKGAREATASIFVVDSSERSIVYCREETFRAAEDADAASLADRALAGQVENLSKLDARIYDWKVKRSAAANEKYVFALLGKYLPGYVDYLRSEDQKALLGNMGSLAALETISTLFHETTHGLTRASALGGSADYPLSPSERIAMKARPTFPAREIDSIAPDEVRKLFRYSTYIAPSSATGGTQVNGFYGLLDEYNAYNWSTRIGVLLYPALKGEFGSEHPEVYVEYLGGIASDRYAVDSFKIFIAWYLKKAQRDDPKLFKKIVGDPKVKEMFARIEGENGRNLEEYERILADLRATFGPRIEFRDGNVFTLRGGGYAFARSLQDAETAQVLDILRKEDYAILQKLRK